MTKISFWLDLKDELLKGNKSSIFQAPLDEYNSHSRTQLATIEELGGTVWLQILSVFEGTTKMFTAQSEMKNHLPSTMRQ